MTVLTLARTHMSSNSTSSNIPQRDYKNITGYRFIDKDPDIDTVLSLIDQSGMADIEVAEKANLAVTTLRRWRYGDTKRPQRNSMCAILGALGYEYKIVSQSSQEFVDPSELPEPLLVNTPTETVTRWSLAKLRERRFERQERKLQKVQKVQKLHKSKSVD